MKRKWLTGALVLAMAAVTLAGCGAKDETKEKVEQVTLNEVAHSIFYAPQYVAIEEGYFADEGIDLTLITGFGADKVLTAMISGEADIGFMGAEATVYAYLEGTADPVVNFAQLTQRAGNFVVGREKDNSFTWEKLKNKEVLGGRKGGMPEMVFEYILKKNNLDPATDLSIDQSIDFGSTAAAFSGGQGDYTVEFEPSATALEQEGSVIVMRGGAVKYKAEDFDEPVVKKKLIHSEEKEIIARKAAALVERGAEVTFSYYDFPPTHWRSIRINNPPERINRELRRRTRVVGNFPDGQSALMLVCARLRYIAGHKWGTERYLNMRPLYQPAF